MDRTTNAALRLHRMLLALRGASREGRPIRQVLGEVFELQPDDDLALRRRLLAVDDLFVESEAAIRSIPGLGVAEPASRRATSLTLLTPELRVKRKRCTLPKVAVETPD